MLPNPLYNLRAGMAKKVVGGRGNQCAIAHSRIPLSFVFLKWALRSSAQLRTPSDSCCVGGQSGAGRREVHSVGRVGR